MIGDLKLDLPEVRAALAPDLDRAVDGVPLLVGGSTHPGEERSVLDALARVEAAGLSAALVLAPRIRSARRRRAQRARRRTPRAPALGVGTEPLGPARAVLTHWATAALTLARRPVRGGTWRRWAATTCSAGAGGLRRRNGPTPRM